MMPIRRSLLICGMWFLLGPGSAGAKKPLPPKKPPPAASAALAAGPGAESKASAEAPTAAPAPEAKPSAEPAATSAGATNATTATATATAPESGSPITTTPTPSPEQLALAKQHFDAGTQAFAEMRYEVALNEFTTSFELSKEPDLLYNLYRVALRLDQKELALSYLREYVRYRPEERAKLQAEMDQLSAPPAPLPPVLSAPAASAEASRPALRWPGTLFMVLGGASAATGAALLVAYATLPADGVADHVRSNSLAGAGGFLVATGAVELIAGAAIYAVRRPKASLALVPASAGASLVGRY